MLSATLSNTFPSTSGLSRGWDRRLAELSDSAGVYERMHGTSWFTPDGQWSTWDATPRLGEVRVPTLIVGGTRDQRVPELAL